MKVAGIGCLIGIFISGLTVALKAAGIPDYSLYVPAGQEQTEEPVKQVTVTGKTSVCEGGDVVLKAEIAGIARYSLAWRKVGRADSLAVDVLELPLNGVDRDMAGEYYCQVVDSTDNNKLVESARFTLTVPVLSLEIGPAGTVEACEGDTLKLWANAARVGTDTLYRWTGPDIQGDAAGDTVRVVAKGDAQWELSASFFGCETSAVKPVTVRKTARIQASADRVDVCEGESLVLRASEEGIAYAWEGEGIETAEKTLDTVAIRFGGNGEFVLNSRNGMCEGTDTIRFRVGHTARIQDIPGSPEVCRGDSLVLRATPEEGGTYLWKGDGILTADKTLDTVAICFGGNGEFVLNTKNGICEGTDTIRFKVRQPARIQAPTGQRDVCRGETVTLRATVPDEGTTYVWEGEGIETVEKTLDTVAIRFGANGEFVLNSRNGMCAATDTIRYRVDQLQVNIDRAGLEETVCYGDTIVLKTLPVEDVSVGYTWGGEKIIEGQGTNQVRVVVTENGEFVVTATDGQCTVTDTVRFGIQKYEVSLESSARGNIACYQEEVVLRAVTPTGVSFHWEGPGITDGADLQEARVRLSEAASYVLKSSDGKCHSVDTLDMGVQKYDVSIAPVGLQVCYGDEFTIRASNAASVPEGGTYSWTGTGIVGAADQAEVALRVTDNPRFILEASDGYCTTRDTVTFDVRKYTVDIVPSLLVMGEREVSLNARASDGVDFSWKWYQDEVTTDNTTDHASFHIAASCRIVVEVSKDGCVVKDTCQVKLFDGKSRVFKGGQNDGFSESKPVLRLVHKNMEVCQTQTAVIALHEHTYENFNYEWYKVGFDEVVGREPALTIVNCDPALHDGRYFCRVQEVDRPDEYITSDTMDYFRVTPGPVADIVVPGGKTGFCSGEEFTLASLPENADRYVWTGPGLAGEVEGREMTTTALLGGQYRVEVFKGACSSEDTLTIQVKEPLFLTLEQHVLNLNGPKNLQFEAIKKNPESVISWNWQADGRPDEIKSSKDAVAFDIATAGKMVARLEEDGCEAEDSCMISMFIRTSDFYHGGDEEGFAESVPQLRISKQQKKEFCEGETIRLELNSYGFTGAYYTWWRLGEPDDVKVAEGALGEVPLCDVSYAGQYYCVARNKDAVVYSDTVAIGILEAPHFSIEGGKNQDVCIGLEKSFTLTPVQDDWTYLWQGAGIGEGESAPAIRVNTRFDGLYTVEVRNLNNCTTRDTVYLHVKKPYFNIVENIRLAEPADVKVAAESEPLSGEVKWYFRESLQATGTGTDSITLTGLDATGLLVAQTTVEGCACSDSAWVFVKAPVTFQGAEEDGFTESRPLLRVENKDIRICEANDTVFRLSTRGSAYYIYEWWDATRNRKVGTGQELPMPHVEKAQAGEYYCKIVNYNGSSELYSDTLKLSVYTGPVAKISEHNRFACYGSECVLDVNGTAAAWPEGVIYNWTGPGLENETGPSVRFTAFTSGTYRVAVTDGGMCTSWDTLSLTVKRIDVGLIASLRLSGPQEVDFHLTAPENVQVEWWVNSEKQLTAERDVNFHLSQEGRVVARVSDEVACVDSAVCRVFMKNEQAFSVGAMENDGFAELRPQLKIVKYDNWDFCAHSTVKLEVQETGYTNYIYKWYKIGSNEVIATGRVLEIKDFQEKDDGKYYCVAVNPDSDDVMSSDTVTVNYMKGPDIKLTSGEVPVVCRGQEITFDARLTDESVPGVDLIYRWEGDASVSAPDKALTTVSPWEDVVYKLTVTDPTTRCTDSVEIPVKVDHPELAIEPSVVMLPAPREYRFEAYNPDNLALTWGTVVRQTDHPGDATGILNMTEDCRVYVKANTGRCEISDTCDVWVKKQDFPLAGFEEDGFVESGMQPAISLDKEGMELVNGDWMLRICTRNPLRLNALVRGNGVYTYRWKMVGRETEYGESSRTLLIPGVRPIHAGRYYCLMEDRTVTPALVYSSDTITVEVQEGPNAEILSPSDHTVACDGVNIRISAYENAGYTYQWTTDGQILPQTTPVIEVSPKGSGVYILRVDDGQGCSAWDTLSLDMNIPRIELPEMVRLGAPQEIVLTPEKPEGQSTLNWYVNYLKDIPDLADADVGRLQIRNDCQIIVEIVQAGCYGYDTTNVYVKHTGTFIGGGDDGFALSMPVLSLRQKQTYIELCRGGRAELEVTSTSPGKLLRYEWRKKGAPDVIGEEKKFVIPVCDLKDAGKYFCTAIDVAETDIRKKTVVSDTAEIVVLSGPLAKISFPVDGSEVCEGGPIVLDASETAADKEADGYEYEWQGENILSGKNFYRGEARAGGNGTYILKVTNGSCTSFDTATVKINSLEVDIPATLYLEKKAYHTFTLENPLAYSVNWYIGNELQESTADTARLMLIQDCEVIVQVGEGGCAASDTCAVFIKDTRPYVRSLEGDGFYVSGNDFLIREIKVTEVACVGMTADFAIVVEGNDYYRYAWKKVGSDEVVSTERTFTIPAVTKADEGDYFCEVTDVTNKVVKTSNERRLSVIALPKAQILTDAADGEVCAGDRITLTADAGEVPAGVSYSYLWIGPGISGQQGESITFTPTKTAEYTLTVGEQNCMSRDTLTVRVSKPYVRVPKVIYANSGENVTLQAEATPGVTIDWRVNGAPYQNVNPLILNNVQESAEYYAETGGKCKVKDAGKLFVRNSKGYTGGVEDGFARSNGLPQIVEQSPLVQGCGVDTASLFVRLYNDKGVIYTWQKYDEVQGYTNYRPHPSSTVTGLGTARLYFSKLIAEDEGKYRCLVQNANGITDSKEMYLVKGDTPEISSSLRDQQSCVGTDVQLIVTAVVKNGNDPGYKWYKSSTASNFEQFTPEIQYNHPYLDVDGLVKAKEGYYMVEAWNLCGSVYDTAYLEVWEKPTIVRQNRDTAVCNQGSIRLWVEAAGGGRYTYSLIQVEKIGTKWRDVRTYYDEGFKPFCEIDPATAADAGWYVWRVRNDCDSVRGVPFELSVENELEIRHELTDTTVCLGTTLAMNAAANVVPTPTTRYSWEKDGNKLNTVLPVHTVSYLSLSDTGRYTCYAYTSCRAKAIADFVVHKKERPVITTDLPQTQAVYCEGMLSVMEVKATSDAGDITYEWYHDNRVIADQTGRVEGTKTPVLTIDSVIGTDAGLYKVKLTNVCGTTTGKEQQLVVDLPARYMVSGDLTGKDQYLCEGQTATFQVKVEGVQPITYLWFKDGQLLKNEKSPLLQLSGVTHADEGNYCCYVSNRCTDTDLAAKTCAGLEVLTPLPFQVLGAGKYCGTEAGKEVTLSGFEKDVIYRLYRISADGTTSLSKEVKGADVPEGEGLSFGLVEFGKYYVQALRTKNGKTCEARMNGEIEIIRDATPEVFRFYVSDPMCTGESSATLSLGGSENNTRVEYTLQKFDAGRTSWSDYGRTLQGTGSGLSWKNMPAGVYRVMAVNTLSACQVQMGQTDTVTERPYPQKFALLAQNNDTTACAEMTSDVVLYLDGSEPLCEYTLMKNGTALGQPASGNNLIWKEAGPGVYTVSATTAYGCRLEMGHRKVVEKPAPLQYSLTGDSYFCAEETGTREVVVNGLTQEGIRYDIYGTDGNKLDALFGTGDKLTFRVPVKEGEFYVQAVDTLDNCVIGMLNKVKLTMDKLTLTPAPLSQLPAGLSTQLMLTVTGYVGNLTFAWEPAAMLEEGQATVQDPRTLPIERSTRFSVTVNDDLCSKQAFVDVIVEGETLGTQIQLADCFTAAADTITVCEGDPVNLCSWTTGGTGDYTWRWTDGNTTIGSGRSLDYVRPEDGYLYLHVSTAVGQEAKDSIWVRHRALPALSAVTGSGLNCVNPGEEVEIRVEHPEQGVDYTFEYARVPGVFAAVGESMPGEGVVSKTIVYGAESSGYYRVKAEKAYVADGLVCVSYPDTAELRQAPQKYELAAVQNDSSVCAGMTSRVELALGGFEEGCTYTLIKNEIENTERQVTKAPVTWNKIDPGVYSVLATSEYGCMLVMGNQKVVELPAPENIHFKGGGYWCNGETEDRTLTLGGNTQTSVRYDVYVLNQGGAPMQSVRGTGTPASFTVPLEEKTYYVIATDVETGCMAALTDTVTLEQGFLEISTRDQLIQAGFATRLDVTVAHAKGQVNIAWEPKDRLVAGEENLHNPHTLKLLHGERFTVTVSDEACTQTADLNVSLDGEPLYTEIRMFDCYTQKDTLVICEGTSLELCSYTTGGAGTYLYEWRDENQRLLGRESRLKGARIYEDGYVYLHVTSTEPGHESKDSIWIAVEELPLLPLIDHEGVNCLTDGESVDFKIHNSATGVRYTLEYSTDRQNYTAFGESRTGNGGDLSFIVPWQTANAGYYRMAVEATYPAGAVCASYGFIGEVRRAPAKYGISVRDAEPYCEGTRPDSIVVAGSEAEVGYRLIDITAKKNVAQQTGNGQALVFAGYYGSGSYKVVAEAGACIDTMQQQVDITALPSPVISEVDGAGPHCLADLPVTIRINKALQGVKYTLFKENTTGDVELGVVYGQQNTAVAFGEQLTELGGYYITAGWPGNGCTDTLRGITVTEGVEDILLSVREGVYCGNEEGWQAGIKAYATDPSVRYILQDKSDNRIGEFTGRVNDTVYFKGLLTEGKYYVYAEAGSCSKLVGGEITVKKQAGITDKDLLGTDLIACENREVPMGVQLSQNGIRYQLIRITESGTEELEYADGNGGDLTIASHHLPGHYQVVATDLNTACTSIMKGEYVIQPRPEYYRLLIPETVYCESDRGVEIGISGTQVGMNYRLQVRNESGEFGDVTDAVIVGTGGDRNGNPVEQYFGGRYAKGTYRIVTNYCNGEPMLDTVEVIALPAPQVLVPQVGNACEGQPMEIVLKGAEDATSYMLYYRGVLVGDTLRSDGRDTSWKLDAASLGEYTMKAKRGTCAVDFGQKITVGEPTNFGDLFGWEETICANAVKDLYLNVWEEKSVYKLYGSADTLVKTGTANGTQMVFGDIQPGDTYSVVAENGMCKTRREGYTFHAYELPVFNESQFAVSDCAAEGLGDIILSGLNPVYTYRLTGYSGVNVIKNTEGEVTLPKNATGEYCLTVSDGRCTTSELCKTIKEGIPEKDTLLEPLLYCAGGPGVRPVLSNSTFKVSYAILNMDGTVIEKLTYPEVNFKQYYPVGKYIFRKERNELVGEGCWTEEVFEVKEQPIPNVAFGVQLGDGSKAPLCEAGNNRITVKGSEAGTRYILMHESGQGVDTLTGNGSALTFSGRKPDGDYLIIAEAEGMCRDTFAGAITVLPVPDPITAYDCEYCYDPASPQTAGCAIAVQDLNPIVVYSLRLGGEIAKLEGYNSGEFKNCLAGDYVIVGTDPRNGCSDTVAKATVKEIQVPEIFTVVNTIEGGNCAASVDIMLSGSEEGVEYFLYQDETNLLAGPLTAEAGAAIGFGQYSAIGDYKVLARRSNNESCSVWMDGVISVYPPMDDARFVVEGGYCANVGDKGVKLILKNSKRGWDYFVECNGRLSEVKSWNRLNPEITWDRFDGGLIREGVYTLYGRNACGEESELAVAEVKPLPLPEAFHIVKEEEGFLPVLVCYGDQFEVKIDSSQVGVSYTLTSQGEELPGESVVPVAGTGDTLTLGKLDVQTIYYVSAKVDSSGCGLIIDSLNLRVGNMISDPGVGDSSICARPGVPQEIIISLDKRRQPTLDYVLLADGVPVDTIPKEAYVALKTFFDPQHILACYTVLAIDGKCVKEYEGYCLSTAPQDRPFILDGIQKICSDETVPLAIDGSENGVNYFVMKDGQMISQGMPGTGNAQVLMDVSAPGKYKVQATVGDCSIVLSDSMVVEILPRPVLNLEKVPETFCAGSSEGVKIQVNGTQAGVDYVLKKGKITLATIFDAVDDAVMAFSNTYTEGDYVVTATYSDGSGCIATDTVKVRAVPLPSLFDVALVGSPYLCEGIEPRQITLSGSEPDVAYTLKKMGDDPDFSPVTLPGTGSQLVFQVLDSGTFYVEARSTLQNNCSNRMNGEVTLSIPEPIQEFVLEAENDSYCYTDEPSGRIVLSGSVPTTVEYQLYQDNQPYGEVRKGTGSMLSWNNLPGKACDHTAGDQDGFRYQVRATDKNTGCSILMQGTVNVIEESNVVIQRQDTAIDACIGDSIAIQIVADGCRLNYKWTRDDAVVGENRSYFSVDSVRPADIGIYRCVVSNKCTPAGKSIMPVRVKVRDIVIRKEEMKDVLVCGDLPQTVQIASTASAEHYKWMKLGDTVTLSKKPTYDIPQANTGDAGQYVCYAYTSCGGLYDTCRLEFNRMPSVEWNGALEATLCNGSALSLAVESRDSVTWFKDETLLATRGNLLVIDSVGLNDGGKYFVTATNACDETGKILIQQLHVDDTLRMLAAADTLGHYCSGSDVRLFVGLNQTARVAYKWYGDGVRIKDENTAAYTTRVWATSPEHKYVVEYANTCNEGSHSMQVIVDDAVKYDPLPPTITWCAGPGEEELRVVETSTCPMNAVYTWYYRPNPGAEVVQVGGDSSVLVLPKRSERSGDYYFTIANACLSAPQTSAVTHLTVDSIPEVLNELGIKKELCENDDLSLTLSVKGGNVIYKWSVLRRDGTVQNEVMPKTDFVSEATLTLPNLQAADDSCWIWCEVTNDCRTTYSDTLQVRVIRKATVEFADDLVKMCPGSPIKVPVKLAYGKPPFLYEYTKNDGTPVVRSSAGNTDTLVIEEAGRYRVITLQPNNNWKCWNTAPDRLLMVDYFDPYEVVISGDNDICVGEKAGLRIQVNGGTGPWNIEIRRRSDDKPAFEVGDSSILISTRDTVLHFIPMDGERYYLHRAIEAAVPNACAAEVRGEGSVILRQPDHVSFMPLAKNTYGTCQQIDLDTELKPSVAGGKYYVDNRLTGNTLQRAPGQYRVKYVTENAYHCIDSAVVTLQFDSLPTVTITAKTDLCPKEETTVVIRAHGTGPFTLTGNMGIKNLEGHTEYYQIRKRSNADNEFLYTVYNSNAELMKSYEITSVKDAYGCDLAKLPDEVFINMRKLPSLLVEGLYEGEWTSNTTRFVIPDESKMYFRFTQQSGTLPWELVMDKTLDGTTQQFVYSDINQPEWQKDLGEGLYTFTIRDRYCSSAGDAPVTREVAYTEQGYLRVKAFLEGAFDAATGSMKSELQSVMPKKSIGNWSQVETNGRQIIDWVTLELRKEIEGEAFCSGDFLLLSDGTVVDTYGDEALSVIGENFSSRYDNEYYVIIKHRNHLALASVSKCRIATEKNRAELMDFTNPLKIYCKDGKWSLHMKSLGLVNGKDAVGLMVGNVLGNSLISIANPNQVLRASVKEHTVKGYYLNDVNFDGYVTWPDQNMTDFETMDPNCRDDAYIIYKNRNNFSEIP